MQSKGRWPENCYKRNNLLLYSVQENADKTGQKLETSVKKDILRTYSRFIIVTIERIQRHNKLTKKPRPITFKLLDSRYKASVLKNCLKLKGTNYEIGEDLSACVCDIKGKLCHFTKEHRAFEAKVSLLYLWLWTNYDSIGRFTAGTILKIILISSSTFICNHLHFNCFLRHLLYTPWHFCLLVSINNMPNKDNKP